MEVKPGIYMYYDGDTERRCEVLGERVDPRTEERTIVYCLRGTNEWRQCSLQEFKEKVESKHCPGMKFSRFWYPQELNDGFEPSTEIATLVL